MWPLWTWFMQHVLVEFGVWGNHRWATDQTPCALTPREGEVANRSGVQLILPSVGQTGTTSVTDALRLMGYRTYHIEETALYARPALRDYITAEEWALAVSRCRLDAMSLEPQTDLFPSAMATSPGAKVIMTWRSHKPYLKSTVAGGFYRDFRWGAIMHVLSQSCRGLPWIRLWDTLTGDFTRIIRASDPFMGRGQVDFRTFFFYKCYNEGFCYPENRVYGRGVFVHNESEEAYLASIDEIRRLTPPGRLLEFDVQRHGWPELSQFLGRPIPAGLNAKSRIPHSRNKDSFTNDALFDNEQPYGYIAIAVFLLLHIANLVVWGVIWELFGRLWAKGYRRTFWAIVVLAVAHFCSLRHTRSVASYFAGYGGLEYLSLG